MFENDPAQWEFNDKDLEDYGPRYFAFRKDWAEDGTLSKSWELSRGHGAAVAILPVLGLETYPEKDRDAAALDGVTGLPAKVSGYTSWAYLSIRRIARLSGLDVNTVMHSGLPQIERLGWGQSFVVPCKRSANGRRRYFRLDNRVFGTPETGYFPIWGSLFYGGVWPVMPGAAKQLYLAIGGLDPVLHDRKFREAMGSDGVAEERMSAIRKQEPVSFGELQRASGLGHSTLHETIKLLMHPLFRDDRLGPLPLVKTTSREAGDHHDPKGYSLNEVIGKHCWHWDYDYLNNTKLDEIRRDMWPSLRERQRARRVRLIQKKEREQRRQAKRRRDLAKC